MDYEEPMIRNFSAISIFLNKKRYLLMHSWLIFRNEVEDKYHSPIITPIRDNGCSFCIFLSYDHKEQLPALRLSIHLLYP